MSPFMQEALAEAARGIGQTSPNPAVGAVLVKDGQVVGRGHHIYAGVKHAEVLAIAEAGSAASGASLYVTLEPCSHHGRTSPCADAVIAAGIKNVVVAMQDPNPLVAGRGLARLREAGIGVTVEVESTSEAERLNEPFVHFMKTGLPLVTLKAALTLDGKIAAPEDNTGWITSETARLHVQTLRHRSDTLLTGIGTVLADDPLLNDRSALPRSRPLMRIIVDSLLRLPASSKMVLSAANDLTVITTSAASEDRRNLLQDHGVQVLVFDGSGGRTHFPSVVRWLAEQSYLSLMIEAGSKVNWSALESGVVDKIFFYYAPKILGGMQSLPVAGGAGMRRRIDAIVFRDLHLHPITADEFAVEGYLAR